MKQFNISEVQPEMLDVVKEFPKIFLEPSVEVLFWIEQEETPKDQVVNLRFGFEHDLGWKKIVRGFCSEMQALCDEAAANGWYFQYKAAIMKEKFGQFRPQGDYECDDHMPSEVYREYIDRAYEIESKWENESYKVCEVTGKKGKLYSKGWKKTLCKEEAKKANYI